MSIHLDWEVESDFGEEQVAEDPAIVARQRRRKRLLLIAGVAATIILIGGAAAFLIRDRQIKGELQEALDATIAAETLALRIGDESAFMRLQAEESAWREHQRATFLQYQGLGPRTQTSGEVVLVEINGTEARVVIRDVIGGETQDKEWLYQYTENGWRHVSSSGELPRQLLSFPTFSNARINYFAENEAAAAQLDQLVSNWWLQTRLTTGHFEPEHILLLYLDSSADAQLIWVEDEDAALVVPLNPSGALSFNTRQTLRHELVSYWVREAKGGGFRPDEEWAEFNLTHHILAQIDPAQTPPRILTSLVETHPNFIKTFIVHLRSNDAATALQYAMIETAPSITSEAELITYLTAYLRAESAFRQWEIETLVDTGEWQVISSEIFQDEFRRYNSHPLWRQDIAPYVLAQANSRTLEVVDTVRYDDLLWAEVSVNDGQRRSLFVPFRYDGTRWWHTVSIITDNDERVTITVPHLTLILSEYDVRYADGLGERVSAAYDQTITDFGLEDDQPDAHISVVPVAMPIEPGTVPEQVTFLTLSPMIGCCQPSQTPEDYLHSEIVSALVRDLLAFRMNTSLSTDTPRPILEGIIRWQTQRAGASPPTTICPSSEIVPLTRPEELWAHTRFPNSAIEPCTAASEALAGQAFITVIADSLGPESIIQLIDRPFDASEMNNWLLFAVGIDVDSIREAWRVEYEQLLKVYYPMHTRTPSEGPLTQ